MSVFQRFTDHAVRWLSALVLLGAYAWLLGPIVLVALISFSADNFLNFPPQEWGLRWYRALLSNDNFVGGFKVSAFIATSVTLLSLVLGVPAAYAISRHRFRGRDLLFTAFTAPLLLPSIVLGLAILLVFFRLQLVATYTGLILGHLVVTLPFVIRIMATALSTLPRDVEDAAATLGATPLRVFFRVTLPLLVPGVIASAALAFIISFDEVVISLFLVGPRLTTLPVEIFRYVDERTDPLVASLSMILILFTGAIVLILERTVGFMRAMSR